MLEQGVTFAGWNLVFIAPPDVNQSSSLRIGPRAFITLSIWLVLSSGLEIMVSLIDVGNPLDGLEPMLLDQEGESPVGWLP